MNMTFFFLGAYVRNENVSGALPKYIKRDNGEIPLFIPPHQAVSLASFILTIKLFTAKTRFARGLCLGIKEARPIGDRRRNMNSPPYVPRYG